jgi:integrase/recombinase XerD
VDLREDDHLSQPVEYAVAVDRFLSAAALGDGSRRIYRIALATWAWGLVDHTPPTGDGRRNATPPALPLPLLDTPLAAARLRSAFDARSAAVGVRTANRELSILVGAVTWWRAQGWLTGDPTSGLRPLPLPKPRGEESRIDAHQARAVLELRAPLREQTFWHLLYETGAPIERVLALDVDDLNLPGRRTRERGEGSLRWGDGAALLLPLLVLGRVDGPLFTTSRGRLSYRRAAEVFTAATRPLDPRGHGWTLHQFSAAGRH